MQPRRVSTTYHRRSPRSRSVSPAPPPHTRTPPPHRSPLMDRDSESASGQEAPPTVPHLLNLDLEERDDRIPSESDVQDILSFAHAPHSQVTAENLRQAKMEGRKTHRSKQDSSRTGKKMAGSGHGGGKIQDNVAPSGQGLLITHGKPELVSTSYLLGNQDAGEEEEEEGRGRGITQKKTKKARRAESDDERLGGGTRGFVMRGAGESRGSGEGLVMKLDKKFCHSNSDSSILSHSVPSTPSSDLTPTFSQGSSLSYPHRERDLRLVCSELHGPGTARPSTVSSLPPTPTSPHPRPSTPLEVVREKRRKKKKKKKKKSPCDKEEEEWEEMVTVAPLKLKITLGKSPKSLDS